MAGGLAALLDDIAVLAKTAAASVDDVAAAAGRASTKAAGVVIDDTAVTPRYVHGFTPDRELPIVGRIALGSLRNKILFILPAALLLSQFADWLLTPILMCGGVYLAFEGAEKVYEMFGGHHEQQKSEPAAALGPDAEKSMVSGAIRTDFILSAEIMVISLNEVTDEPFLSRAIILAFLALVVTAVVYGLVGLIVKVDDVGLHLVESGRADRLGRFLVAAMPRVLSVLSTVGIAAMLWVGGHILLVGVDDLGWHGPYELVHHLEHSVHEATGGAGGVLGWCVNTVCSAVVGLVVGAVVVAILHFVPRRTTAASH
jgi:predicted DNA repair protein MutK